MLEGKKALVGIGFPLFVQNIKSQGPFAGESVPHRLAAMLNAEEGLSLDCGHEFCGGESLESERLLHSDVAFGYASSHRIQIYKEASQQSCSEIPCWSNVEEESRLDPC